MAVLLNAVTTDTVGALASHTGPCTAWVTGVPDGATVVLQGSPTTTTTDVVKMDRSLIPQSIYVNRTGCCAVEGQGTYYLRAIIKDAGGSTAITVTTTQ